MSVSYCPICRRPFDPQRSPAMPFCSQRCRLIDLGRWLDERYGVPIERDKDSAELEPPEPPAHEGQ